MTRRSPTSTTSSTRATATSSSSRRTRTAAMTPAVERACETGKPVIVFDRGVETDCPVTFIHPIGGFAWGIDTAEFLIDEPRRGRQGRGAPHPAGRGRARAALGRGREAVRRGRHRRGRLLHGSRPRRDQEASSRDELAKGDVQGVWMDAGDGAVAAIEAFEDAGADYPVMTGEDEMSFLRKWKETGLTGLAPVYSNFQWRTPLLAAQMIFAGEEVPKEWVLPQSADHRRGGRPVPRGERRHARRPLREVRRRGPAGLPGGLAGAPDSVTRPGECQRRPRWSWLAAGGRHRPPAPTRRRSAKEAACAARSA